MPKNCSNDSYITGSPSKPMCGIIFGATLNKRSVADFILNQYEDQQSRGSRGFGVALEDEKGAIKILRSTEPLKFFFDVQTEGKNAPLILAHHRQPTSSENKCSQTHPILVDHKSFKFRWLIVHNGVISNKDELKKNHDELGFPYTTVRQKNETTEEFNDSESLAIEVARYLEGKSQIILAEGSAAWIALKVDKNTNKPLGLYFARRSNPLRLSFTNNMLFLASELDIKLSNSIDEKKLYSVDLTKKKYEVLEQPIKWKDYVYQNTYSKPSGFGATHHHRSANSSYYDAQGDKQLSIDGKRTTKPVRPEDADDDLPGQSYQERFNEIKKRTKIFDRNNYAFYDYYTSSGEFPDLIEDFRYCYEEEENEILEESEKEFSTLIAQELDEKYNEAYDSLDEFFELLRSADTYFYADTKKTCNFLEEILEEAKRTSETVYGNLEA